jgi:hypothetical protein
MHNLPDYPETKITSLVVQEVVERRNLEADYSADPMLFHAAIACARGSSDT